jgi:membrane protease YdiL (CAAX protease family)
MITKNNGKNSQILQQIWKKVLLLFGTALVLFLLTEIFSEFSFYLTKLIYPKWQHLDPDGSYLYISIHHIFQAIFALVCIGVIKNRMNKSWSDFGFNTNDWRFAIKRVLQFCAFWIVVQCVIAFSMILSGITPVPFHFPLTSLNFVGYFLFQVLLSGTSEEILFRAMVIFPMLYAGKRAGLSDKTNTIIAVVVSILIFILAHVNFSFNPFRVTNFIFMQQLTILTFGAFYAYLLLKTRSLVGPMLAHNWLNGLIVLIGLLVNLVFG